MQNSTKSAPNPETYVPEAGKYMIMLKHVISGYPQAEIYDANLR